MVSRNECLNLLASAVTTVQYANAVKSGQKAFFSECSHLPVRLLALLPRCPAGRLSEVFYFLTYPVGILKLSEDSIRVV